MPLLSNLYCIIICTKPRNYEKIVWNIIDSCKIAEPNDDIDELQWWVETGNGDRERVHRLPAARLLHKERLQPNHGRSSSYQTHILTTESYSWYKYWIGNGERFSSEGFRFFPYRKRKKIISWLLQVMILEIGFLLFNCMRICIIFQIFIDLLNKHAARMQCSFDMHGFISLKTCFQILKIPPIYYTLWPTDSNSKGHSFQIYFMIDSPTQKE